jgi:hypothetical protein
MVMVLPCIFSPFAGKKCAGNAMFALFQIFLMNFFDEKII